MRLTVTAGVLKERFGLCGDRRIGKRAALWGVGMGHVWRGCGDYLEQVYSIVQKKSARGRFGFVVKTQRRD